MARDERRDDRQAGGAGPTSGEHETRQVAPGKVTRTSRLSPGRPRNHQAAMTGAGSPPAVQRKAAATGAGAAARPARSSGELTVDRWMDAAHRGLTALAERDDVQARGDLEADDPAAVHEAADAGVRGSGGALPYFDRIQQAFGAGNDLSGVHAHVGGEARDANERIGASAYASGEHVSFRDAPDLHTAAHEAAHVVQQRAGVRLAGGVGQSGDAYERNADAVADRVVRGQAAQDLLPTRDAAGSGTAVQLAPDSDHAPPASGQARDGNGDEQAARAEGAEPAITGTATTELAAYQGAAVGQPGKISAPASQYEHARSTGVNVRARPDGGLPAIGTVRYDTAVHVLAADTTGAFYFIVARSGGATGQGHGWINRDFVALGMPDPAATLHHVTESNLTEILAAHYVAPGRWRLATGNDYTTLAAAVVAANQGRTGVRIDWQRYQVYKDEHALRLAADPWMRENRAIYHASQVYAGQNIWLPSPAYVSMLQGAGVVGTRPDWVNAAVDVGKGFAGFHAGLAAGVFGSLWDTLSGLWELGETVVGAVSRALDGSLFTELQPLYDELRDLSWQKAQDMIASVVTMARDAFGDFVAQWNQPDVYQQWFFRGRVAGAVALEVVLAILTGGGTLGAKVAAKVGQYAPRLGRVLGKVLQLADDLDVTPGRKRGRDGHGADADPGAPGRDRPGDRDMNEDERDFAQNLAMARIITEAHDLRDTPVDELLRQLNGTLAARSRAVRGYKSYPHPTKPEHHRIVQFSREREVDGDYSGRNGAATRETEFPRKTLHGVSLKWLRKNKPGGWKEIPSREHEGWVWKDQNGVERLRFMRPTGRNPSSNQWSRQANGYFRWQNADGNYLDINGNVVPKGPDFEERTHIMYEGPL
jgi:hypothetical protein